jgi:hypothetical protein
VSNDNPCSALLPDPPGATIGMISGAATSKASTQSAVAKLSAARLLSDSGFGDLEAQLVDKDAGVRSDWAPVAGRFVRVPQIDSIKCDKLDPHAPCQITGANLFLIDGVSDGTQSVNAPFDPCSAAPPGRDCYLVPPYTSYFFHLRDITSGTWLPPKKNLVSSL